MINARGVFRALQARGLTVFLALTMAACGGAEPPSPVAATPDQAMRTIRKAASALVSTASTSTETLANQLLDFGESQFPEFFPGHPATQSASGFLYRHYTTGTYLGVVVDASSGFQLHGVYVMGGPFGGAPLYVGQVSKFTARVAGIALNDEAAMQTNTSPYVLAGQVFTQTQGVLPSLRITTSGAATSTVDVQLESTQFQVPVQLGLGDTTIEVTALDGQDNPIKYTKVVTLNPAPAFNGGLELSNSVVFVNETASVIARVAMASSAFNTSSAKLVEVSANGTETEITSLADGGVLNTGDEVQGDGVFSGKFTLQPSSASVRKYRVRAQTASGAILRSEPQTIRVTTRLSDADLNAVKSAQVTSTAKLKQAEGQGLTALKVAVQQEVQTLLANPLVHHAAANDEGTAVSVIYKSGIAGVIGKPSSSVKGGVAGAAGAAAPSRAPLFDMPHSRDVVAPYANYCPSAAPSAPEGARAQAAAEAPTPKSNRVYALAANYSEWKEDDDLPKLAALMQQNKCLDVTYVKTTTDGGGSVEDFKGLGKYGIVMISSHGDTHFSMLAFEKFSAGTVWENFTPAWAQVVIYSNAVVTTANKATYEADLKAGRLVLWGDVYGIMPSFIKKYSGKMPDSLVYMSICRGSWNNTLADAFIATGAKTFIGYSNYVGVPFTISSSNAFFTEWLKSGKTVANGYASVNPKVESGQYQAEFRVVGATDLQAPIGGLREGGFESGTLGAWKAEGDGRVVAQLGTSGSPVGSYMALISTGLGFTTASGAISQLICLGTETTLTYRWRFYSEEFLEWVGSQYQDSFKVTLQDADAPTNIVTVQSNTVDSLASQVSKVTNSFDRGDVYATAWKTATFTIPQNLRGKRVIVKFAVTDVGDSSYDTAVLLDEIKLQ